MREIRTYGLKRGHPNRRSRVGCSTPQLQTSNERNRPMNKNINTVVELTEKEHECVTGGRRIVEIKRGRFEDRLPIFRKTILIP